MENSSFISFDSLNNEGLLFNDISHGLYPLKVYNVKSDGVRFKARTDCSYYGYVYKGNIDLKTNDTQILHLNDGMCFSVAGHFKVSKYTVGSLLLIEVYHREGVYPTNNYRAMLTVTKHERKGRLNYIDGCTDSLLIPPIKKGDPCLNHLHFPKGIIQTQHTHPTHRVGIVSKGNGTCITPFGNLPLTKGMIFVIKEWDGFTTKVGLDGNEHMIGQHSFETKDSEMDVIAFHPDSDFGATDEIHPMINRTFVDGISASNIESIRTK